VKEKWLLLAELRCCPVNINDDARAGIGQAIAPGVEETLCCFWVDHMAFDDIALIMAEWISRFVDSDG
jgi:hypothetical protein